MNWRQRLSYIRAVTGIMHGSRAVGGPIKAELGLTNRCNIRCIHCYYYSPYLENPGLKPVRMARLMGLELPSDEELRHLQRLEVDTDRTNALIDELTGMGTRYFQFTGAGETFLHENALEFMSRAKHAGCTCCALTAGHMLDREKIDALLKMGFDELRVTTMAGTRDMYLRTHPGIKYTTFDEVRDNLFYLTERKKDLRVRRPEVSLYCIVIAENYDGLFDFAEFAAAVQADRVQYRPFDDLEDPGLAKLAPTTEQASYVREQLAEIKPYLESQGIKHNISNFLKVFGRQLDTTALYRIIPCYYVWLGMRIEPDGILHPCCRCSVPLGNVFEQKFSEIWNGEDYRRLRKEALALNRRKTPLSGCDCNSCTHFMANLRVYRLLHPVRGRSKQLERVCPAA